MLALDPNAQISSSTEVNPGIPETTYVVNATTLRNVVLVAGYDYERNGINHKNLCKNRFERYMKKGDSFEKNPNWRFTLFDVGSGDVSVNEFDPVSRKRAWTVTKSFVPVTDANYTTVYDANGHPHYHFDKNPGGVMSMTDIYEHIRDLGTNHPGSLWELSFFLHGWMGGPILVNSSDLSGSATDRDPNDKDSRPSKDFIPPTMDSTALAAFQSAFHANGFIWIWGCSFARLFHEVIDKVVHNAAYNTAQGPSDADVFVFHFTNEQGNAYFSSAPWFFPMWDAATPQFTVTKTFQAVKDLFQSGLASTYSHAIANASGRKCYGALLGTYADYERGVSLGLMLIPSKVPPYADDFTSYLHFYTKYLDAKIDPEGRGYGEYLP